MKKSYPVLVLVLLFVIASAACDRSSSSASDDRSPAVPERLIEAQRKVPRKPRMTLGECLETPWTRISVAYVSDDGCTGLHMPDALTISRKGKSMTISGTENVAYNEVRKIPERPLSGDEFDELVGKLNEFSHRAKSEKDPMEYFASLPPAEAKLQLEASYKEHGRPLGGFDRSFFWAQFVPAVGDVWMMDAFKESKSMGDYKDWIVKACKGRAVGP